LKRPDSFFYENASFDSHDNLLLVCRGLLTTNEKPTTNSQYEFIVATPVIFIRGDELENRSWGTLLKMPSFLNGGADLQEAIPPARTIARTKQ
jgi:hypothetical protein